MPKLVDRIRDFIGVAGTSKEVLADPGLGSAITDMDPNRIIAWISKLKEIQPNRMQKIKDYERMMKDSLIQTAVDLMCDDATITDRDIGHVVWVNCDTTPEVADILNDWLWHTVKIDDKAWPLIRAIVANGEGYLKTYLSEPGIDKTIIFGAYTEIIRDVTKVMELMQYGKTKSYLVESDEGFKLYTPAEYIHFVNDSGMNRDEVTYDKLVNDEVKKEKYEYRYGTSFLEGAREAYKVIELIENMLLAARLSKSQFFRLFQVDVTGEGRQGVLRIMNEVKQSINSKEYINRNNDSYMAENVPVPIGGNIYIPTANGKGSITVQPVGGDVDVKEITDVEYFRNKLFAALKVPKAFMGFEEFLPGSLGNSALTRLDIRYARTIVRIQNIFRAGVRDLCNLYLDRTNLQQYKNDIDVVMARVSSAEDSDQRDDLQAKIQLGDSLISTMANFEGMYDKVKLRDYIINNIFELKGFDEVLLDPEEIVEEAENQPQEEGMDFGGDDLGNAGGGGSLIPPMGGADLISPTGEGSEDSGEGEGLIEPSREGADLVEPSSNEGGGGLIAPKSKPDLIGGANKPELIPTK